jgi:hypothetical protein
MKATSIKYLVNKFFLLLLLFVAYGNSILAQQSVVKPAGPEYKRSPFYQSLWGHNYRKEWTTPVTFPVLMLDTAYGGLMPYKEGGGHQSKSLHLKTKDGKLYALRSVNKRLRVIIPEIFHNTFIEHIVDDQISMSHPYAALTVPLLADAAKIFHTNPKYVYVPEQPALDTFNKEYANKIYLLEQRPDEDWSDADNLGNFKKYLSSAKVRENIFEDNSREVDQSAFVKARLFDMFIGDWDRHEDQWKWGEVEKNKRTIYKPVPVDRDQPYAKFDGLLQKIAIGSAARYMQNFEHDIKYPEGFSYERRNIDRFFTNRITLDEWQNTAKELQKDLTDDVIEKSIRQLPPEIFAISGSEIIAKLKSRRQHLVKYATRYYLFLAKEVDIVGSEEREYFKVSSAGNNEIEVNIYDLKDGLPRAEPYYTRKFKEEETGEIRMFGLSGKDIYSINGGDDNDIRIRIIGGDDKDSISVLDKGKTVHIYDDESENVFNLNSRAKLHLSSDSMVHAFDYDAFRPEKKGLKPTAGFNDEDRLFIGAEYGWPNISFRKTPVASKQGFGVNYSLSQKAFNVFYTGVFPKLIGGWDLLLKANYDAVRWSNFFGLGNETPFSAIPQNYFRLRTAEWLGGIGLNKKVGINYFTLSGFYSGIRVLRDAGKFITDSYLPSHPEDLGAKSFLGASFQYGLSSLNDAVVPTSGVIFRLLANYSHNLSNTDKSFAKFGGDVQFYVSVIPKISLAISTGAATVTGTPEFYQYPAIGGGANVRGYLRDRFRGKTAFYNSNEIRFITNINTYLLRGKGGLVAFFDDGRVWMPGENSNTFHKGYGGGVLIAPFNTTLLNITYAISKETTQIQFRGILKL